MRVEPKSLSFFFYFESTGSTFSIRGEKNGPEKLRKTTLVGAGGLGKIQLSRSEDEVKL